MHPIGKLLIGVILIVGSVAAVWYSHIWYKGTAYDLWQSFKIVVMGIIPPLVFLVGLFIVWLELDEIKIERELAAEEKKSKKKK